jgi:hypothetical protein
MFERWAVYASSACVAEVSTDTRGDCNEAYSFNLHDFSGQRFRQRLPRISKLRKGQLAAKTVQYQPDPML